MPGRHILFISSWYPNRHNPTHGIFNRYFAEAVSLSNEVSVLHVKSEARAENDLEFVSEETGGIRTLTVYYRQVTSRMPLLSQLMKIRRVLAAFNAGYSRLMNGRRKPDLIHLNVVMPFGIAVLRLAKRLRIPYVVNENWSGYTREDASYRGFFMKHFTRRVIAGASAVMPTSAYLKEAMLSHGLEGNYQVVPNPVNIARFRAQPKDAKGNITLLHISSLNDREKNVSGILRAFAEALKTRSDIRLRIVGEGVDAEKYRRMVKELRMEGQVVFTGRLVADALVRELHTCDALLMFSNYETFSLVNIEAFACGKPVITSNAGAVPEYMQARLGIMVDKGDEAQLKRAILEFAEKRADWDSEYIRQFAVENFSYEKVGAELDRIYGSVLSKPAQ